jgi:hypothetical protein
VLGGGGVALWEGRGCLGIGRIDRGKEGGSVCTLG